MTKGPVLFGIAAGAAVGLYVPKLFGADGFGTINLITAAMGAVLGLIGVAVAVHYYGRIR